MPDLMNIASTAIIAFQSSLNTISNNIANVNTEGYARQQTEFTTMPTSQFGTSYLGNGVQLSSVTRNVDEYINNLMRASYSNYHYSQSYTSSTSYITDLIADPNTSIDSQIQRFYEELQTLTESPSDGAIREAFYNTSVDLAQRFNTTYSQIVQDIDSIHSQMQDQVSSLNALLSSLASINKDIVEAPGEPSHLLDLRDKTLKDISELVNTTILEQDDGSVNLFAGSGQALVIGETASTLSITDSSDDLLRKDISLSDGGTSIAITDFITGGSMGGLLAARDDVHFPAINRLGRVAITLSDTFNNQALLGRDLTGARGDYFFTDINSTVSITNRSTAHASNVASADIAVNITDVTALTVSDYTLSFNNSGANYSLMRDTDGAVVSSGAIGALPSTIAVTADGFSLTLDTGSTFNDSDSYKIQPTRFGASQMEVDISSAAEIPLAGAYLATSNSANQSDMVITQPIIPVNNYSTYTAANPDARVYTVSFPTTSTYRIVDSNGGDTGNLAYTDGMTVTLNNGAQVELTGTPVVGDTFTVSPNTASAVGDARNGVLLGDTQGLQLIENSTLTFQSAFGAMVTDMSVKHHQEKLAEESNKAIYEANESRYNSISGVNLDEEAAQMMRFQQSYQAISQVFNVANSVFDTFLNAINS